MNYDCYRGMLTSKRYIEEDDGIRGLSISVSHPACWYEYGMSVKKDIKAARLVIALRLRNTSYELAVQSTNFAIKEMGEFQLQSGFLCSVHSIVEKS